MDMQLIRRAVVLFPRREYVDAQQVRHARRQWLRSVVALRAHEKSKWILDNRVERLQ